MTTSDKLLERLKKAPHPLLFREIVALCRIPPEQHKTVRRMLRELVRAGSVVKTRGNRYGASERMSLVTGRLQGSREGYGFVIPEQPGEPDVYVHARNMNGAMNGDRVVARVEVFKGEGRREGRIIRILEHAHNRWVGRYEAAGRLGYVRSHNTRIPYELVVDPSKGPRPKDGDYVVADILAYPQARRNPEGKIRKVLGPPDTPGLDTDLIIAEYGLPTRFPKEVVEEARSAVQEVTPELRKGRHDLRDLVTVTIDGENARDFDDAISIEPLRSGGHRLWVHIADVATYVSWNSALDREARERGTSVYFPDRVLPMLPPALSNGICSLNPRKDRLAVTAEIRFDATGRRTRASFYPSVIRSDARMTYTAVRQILVDRDPNVMRKYQSLVPHFQEMEVLGQRLLARRISRGSLDFDLPEPQVILDLQGRTEAIVMAERNVAHRIIEEFMLAANEAVARHLTHQGLSLLFRVHETPDPEKLQDLADLLHPLGYRVPVTGTLKPKALQRLLEQARGTPEEAIVHQATLRTLKQAFYSPENMGHFGLASALYTHFTSPIRRYPDLVVHRVLHAWLRYGGKAHRHVRPMVEQLSELGQRTSQRERMAMEAERDVVEMKKVAFMADKEGEVFDGRITGVTAFGFFVQLEVVFVEGLVHVTRLTDDYYRFHEAGMALVGESRGRRFRLGDAVRVKVLRVDLEKRQIDLELASRAPDSRKALKS